MIGIFSVSEEIQLKALRLLAFLLSISASNQGPGSWAVERERIPCRRISLRNEVWAEWRRAGGKVVEPAINC